MDTKIDEIKIKKDAIKKEVSDHVELLNKFGLYTFLSSLTKDTASANNLMMAALDVLLKNIESANYQKITNEIVANINAMYNRK